MYPHIGRIVAVTLVLALGTAGTDQGQATVIRDGKGKPTIPVVESGGLRLLTHHSPPVPYSLIGAIQSESHWYAAYSVCPWRLFSAFPRHRFGGFRGVHAPPIADGFFGLPLLP